MSALSMQDKKLNHMVFTYCTNGFSATAYNYNYMCTFAARALACVPHARTLKKKEKKKKERKKKERKKEKEKEKKESQW